ncbi:winged helix-turn-helix transcriptional regulator [Streptococcus sp. H49]|uniref:winged helix-turn-helix transcriptional regulator n=1 Tax=Streptococcus huangxiaojuni TaxID=3237239 RepID=UPI0034A3FEB3
MGINITLEAIGGKWKPLLLCYIGKMPMRNGQLLRMIPDISQKVLTEQLRELEGDGIISRKSFSEIPPRVEYYLTEEGKNLRKLLVELSVWGEKRAEKLQNEGQEIHLVHSKHDGYLD